MFFYLEIGDMFGDFIPIFVLTDIHIPILSMQSIKLSQSTKETYTHFLPLFYLMEYEGW